MSRESALGLLSKTASPIPVESSQEGVAPQIEGKGQDSTEPVLDQQTLKSTPFSHLAKKEAELVRQRNEFKKEQETLAAERTQLQEAKKQYDEYQEKKKSDPIAALKLLGFSEQDIFNYMAANQAPELTPEQKAAKAAEEAADKKLQAFEEAQVKKAKEAQDAQDLALITSFKNDIKAAIDSDQEKYEYCAHYGEKAQELAYEIVLEALKESEGKEIITAEQAAQLAEEYFEEKDKEMMKLKKRQPKKETEEADKPEERTRTVTPGFPNAEQPKPTVSRSRTLSSGTTSTVAATRVSRNESREEKRERLMNALRNGKL